VNLRPLRFAPLAAVLLAVPPPSPSADPPVAPAPEELPDADPDSPPPGSPSERALWRRASRTNDRVTTDRSAATRLQLRAKIAVDRVRSAAAAGTLPAERAKGLERDVLEAWTANLALVGAQWPIDPTRACRYPQFYYESAMALPDGKKRTLRVAETKGELEECLGRADRVLARLARSLAALEHEVGEAERALAATSTPSGAAPQGAP
jgi:hypothetical protein